jgi:signal transduction histidine kinase
VGIAPEVHQTIFEPFSTFRPDGGEVGLAMVVGLLRALGGDVRVDSSPGRGSTFTFVLEAEG